MCKLNQYQHNYIHVHYSPLPGWLYRIITILAFISQLHYYIFFIIFLLHSNKKIICQPYKQYLYSLILHLIMSLVFVWKGIITDTSRRPASCNAASHIFGTTYSADDVSSAANAEATFRPRISLHGHWTTLRLASGIAYAPIYI